MQHELPSEAQCYLATQEILKIYGKRRIFTVLKKQLSSRIVSQINPFQNLPSGSLRLILMLSSYQRLGSTNGLFSLDFPA